MGLAWARRDGAGVPVAAVVPVAAAVPSALSVLTALVPVDVAAPSSTVSAVARGCMASAMAAMGIVALTMDVHAIAQSR